MQEHAVDRTHEGRIAVITGGGRGFGKAFGFALAERGAHVVLADIDAAAGEAAAAEIRAAGFSASASPCDVADEAAVTAVMSGIAALHGGIDILINNAGLHSERYNAPMKILGAAGLRRLFDVNVIGVALCALAASGAMAGRKNASIVNISSSAAYGCPTAYGVSKLAVRGLTVTLAHELGPDGIRVNAIAPGLIGTETIRQELSEKHVALVHGQQITKRWGEEADIVATMLYLVSPEAGFVTGETLRISGGFALHV
jgi:NAD(P)-dependent dehydrogenase (short-subunit alcohol dehydrogenase family)